MRSAHARAQPEAGPLGNLLAVILGLPRPVLVRITTRLIDHLDELDGDPDLEEDDHSGDPLDSGELEEWRPEGILLDRPQYGIDQSLGPINEVDAGRKYRMRLLEN